MSEASTVKIYRTTVHICTKEGFCERFKYHGSKGWKCSLTTCPHVKLQEINPNKGK